MPSCLGILTHFLGLLLFLLHEFGSSFADASKLGVLSSAKVQVASQVGEVIKHGKSHFHSIGHAGGDNSGVETNLSGNDSSFTRHWTVKSATTNANDRRDKANHVYNSEVTQQLRTEDVGRGNPIVLDNWGECGGTSGRRSRFESSALHEQHVVHGKIEAFYECNRRAALQLAPFSRMSSNQKSISHFYPPPTNSSTLSVYSMSSRLSTASSFKQAQSQDSTSVIPNSMNVRTSKCSPPSTSMRSINQNPSTLRLFVEAVIVAVIVTAAVTSILVAITFYFCQKYRTSAKVQRTVGVKDDNNISEASLQSKSLSSSVDQSKEFSSHAFSSHSERSVIIFYNTSNRGFTVIEDKGLNDKDRGEPVIRGSENVEMEDKDTDEQKMNSDTSCTKHCASSLLPPLTTAALENPILNYGPRESKLGILFANEEETLSMLSAANPSLAVAIPPSVSTSASLPLGALQPASGSLPVPSLPPSPLPSFYPAGSASSLTVTESYHYISPLTSPCSADSSVHMVFRPPPPPPLPPRCLQHPSLPPLPGVQVPCSPPPPPLPPRDSQNFPMPPHSSVEGPAVRQPSGVKGSSTLLQRQSSNNPRPGTKSVAYPIPPPLQPSLPPHLLTSRAEVNAKKEGLDKPKLKPLHWDKVKFDTSQSMVWDRLQTGSFVLNEEAIEALFGHNLNTASKKASKQTGASVAVKKVGIFDARKAQNIAIQLRALVLRKEDICDALLEGDGLSCELLEFLVKMAPNQEELKRLQAFSDDISQLGAAESFLKGLLEVPFAFERLKAMQFMACFKDDLLHVQESLRILEVACTEIRNSRLFIKLLEAVLKTGNRMNAGTFRGDADAFKLDTLLRLADIKSADGKTTLLHFVIEEIMKAEGVRAVCMMNDTHASLEAEKRDDDYKRMGLHIISSLITDLGSVRKAAGVDTNALSQAALKLVNGIGCIKEMLKNHFQSEAVSMGEISHEDKFHQNMDLFVQQAEEDVNHMQTEVSRVFDKVKHVTAYFHGNSRETQPLHLFLIVSDFLQILDKVCGDLASAFKVNRQI